MHLLILTSFDSILSLYNGHLHLFPRWPLWIKGQLETDMAHYQAIYLNTEILNEYMLTIPVLK